MKIFNQRRRFLSFRVALKKYFKSAFLSLKRKKLFARKKYNERADCLNIFSTATNKKNIIRYREILVNNLINKKGELDGSPNFVLKAI